MGANSGNQGVNTDQKKTKCGQVIKDNLLIILTLVGVVLGFGLSFGIRPLKPSEDAMLWIGLPAEIYMRMLTCTILPLVVSSIIAGTSTLDPKSNGQINTIALLYITLVNLFGVILGIIMYLILEPGSNLPLHSLDNSGGDYTIKMGANSGNQGVNTDQKKTKCGQVIKDNLLIILTLVGVVLGFGLSFGIRPLKPSEDAMLWIGLRAEIYMRMLTCTILPLVVSSIIAGTSTLDPKSNGQINTIALLYITLVNLFGVILGIIMYLILEPDYEPN